MESSRPDPGPERLENSPAGCLLGCTGALPGGRHGEIAGGCQFRRHLTPAATGANGNVRGRQRSGRRRRVSRRGGQRVAPRRNVLDRSSVLFSFHIGKSSGWLWAADRQNVSIYRIADFSTLKADAAALTQAVRKGDPGARGSGQKLYQKLFGGVANSYLSHPRWLLELDGPLFDVPFPAAAARRE